jgi:hypothetical protein
MWRNLIAAHFRHPFGGQQRTATAAQRFKQAHHIAHGADHSRAARRVRLAVVDP